MNRIRLWFEYLFLSGVVGLLPASLSAQETADKDISLTYTVPSNLVQGRIYSPNYFPIKGSPFLTESWEAHDFNLQNNEYHNMPVWYDIYADDLILLYQQGQNLLFIRLNRKHVKYFKFSGREFVNITYSRFRDTGLPDGYYEILREGQIGLLAKRKLLVEDNTQDWTSSFFREDRWYLWKDGKMRYLHNKKSLLDAVDEQYRKPVIRFAKKSGIRLKHAGDREWEQMVDFLNTLN
ncbi:MAG: hypothetical protein R2824_01420 [Saprospiraceae bacterium]|nr:hypothetical protein [Lewinella sp.]